MQDFYLIADWISENFSTPEKIVEVGIGNMDQTMERLKKEFPNTDLIATDTREASVPEGVKFFVDDISDPEMDIYRGADLVYSLRTPPELYPHLKDVAEEVGANLLVKPVSSEESPAWGELVNYSGTVFYAWIS